MANELFLTKRLEIQNYDCFLKELQTYYLKHVFKFEDMFSHLDAKEFLDECPVVKKWTEENNLKLKVAAIIISKPGKMVLDPHVDTQPRSLAINFPVQNCEGCWTSLYKLSEGQEVTKTLPNGRTYIAFSENAKFEEIARFTLDTPVIFNTKVPHKVWNPTNNIRVSASLRFDPDPWWLL
jgi:hypothetical protein